MLKRLGGYAGVMLLAASVAHAQAATGSDVGAVELSLIERVLTGNIGLGIGLIVTILGIVTIIKGRMGGGLFLIVMGVLITVMPGVYNGVREVSCAVASSLGGHCGSQ